MDFLITLLIYFILICSIQYFIHFHLKLYNYFKKIFHLKIFLSFNNNFKYYILVHYQFLKMLLK